MPLCVDVHTGIHTCIMCVYVRAYMHVCSRMYMPQASMRYCCVSSLEPKAKPVPDGTRETGWRWGLRAEGTTDLGSCSSSCAPGGGRGPGASPASPTSRGPQATAARAGSRTPHPRRTGRPAGPKPQLVQRRHLLEGRVIGAPVSRLRRVTASPVTWGWGTHWGVCECGRKWVDDGGVCERKQWWGPHLNSTVAPGFPQGHGPSFS